MVWRVIDEEPYDNDSYDFDAETAEVIHAWANGDYVTDYNYIEMKLYKTADKEYFIVQEGMSLHEVIPVGVDEALEFLEQHDGTEAILKEFPDLIEEA